MLSLGLLLPLGAGAATDGLAKGLAQVTAPAKHVTLVRDGSTQQLITHAGTADDLLAQNGIVRTPDDALSVAPDSSVSDGETIVYRSAVPLTLVVDGSPTAVHVAAATVADALRRSGVAWDDHDRVAPSPAAPVSADETIRVTHVNSWTEVVRRPIAPPVVKKVAFGLGRGRTQVIAAGRPGVREIRYAVVREAERSGTRRITLGSRILRHPRTRIVAEGVGDYAALAAFAARGVDKTLVMASAALSMIATAYTAECAGCSGTTAIGRPAGHGIVAVDPRVIPLGTRMFIPGYGRAIAGDTGGAIKGRRIDLGFDSRSEALSFGRRPVTVYLLP